MGFDIIEIPALLRARTAGKSKFKFKKAVMLHLKFTLKERPMILFNFFGILLTAIGLTEDWALGSLRVTVGRGTMDEDIERFIDVLPATVKHLRGVKT